ncbi:MAG: CoA-binding protein, partial [Phycisphaerae bacterium]|nr:CoA-binding protein [Phycisphaerae bacterium]
ADRLRIIRDDGDEIDGVKCVPSFDALKEPVDMAVIAAPASELPTIIDNVNNSGKVHAGIMISGGVGETEGTEEIEAAVREAIVRGHARPDGGTVFLGPNCMGLQSRPGHYDTFFIPENKLDTRWSHPARRVALISQSGAFIISRMSNLTTLDAALAISIGNQMDLTVADLLDAVGERDDIDAIGVYVEGFANLDGLDFLRAVKRVTAAGKAVVFYKAGRTATGRTAAAGHTASVAGDYDIAMAAAEHAGAIVTETFKEFEQLLELATYLHGKQVHGRRLFTMSNAGMEAVRMADTIQGQRYEVSINTPSDALRERMVAVLARHKLDRLVNPRNPLDVTPMASEAVYEDVIKLMSASDEMDAMVISAVPLAPNMLTTADEIGKPGSFVERIPRLFAESAKPLIFVVDCGPTYDALAGSIREAGVPVFRSSDQAVRSLGRYLTHRTRCLPDGQGHCSAHMAEPVCAGGDA